MYKQNELIYYIKKRERERECKSINKVIHAHLFKPMFYLFGCNNISENSLLPFIILRDYAFRTFHRNFKFITTCASNKIK